MEMQRLLYEPLVIVAGPRNQVPRRRRLKLSDLVETPWILSTLEAEDGSPFVEAFRSAKLSVPAATIFSNSLHLRNNLLATGRYLTLVPGSALRFGPEGTLLKALPIELPRWHLPTGVFWLKRRMLSPVAHLFLHTTPELPPPPPRPHSPPPPTLL